MTLQVIDSQYFSFLSTHSSGYASQKELCLTNQALTNHLNIHFEITSFRNSLFQDS